MDTLKVDLTRLEIAQSPPEPRRGGMEGKGAGDLETFLFWFLVIGFGLY